METVVLTTKYLYKQRNGKVYLTNNLATKVDKFKFSLKCIPTVWLPRMDSVMEPCNRTHLPLQCDTKLMLGMAWHVDSPNDGIKIFF